MLARDSRDEVHLYRYAHSAQKPTKTCAKHASEVGITVALPMFINATPSTGWSTKRNLAMNTLKTLALAIFASTAFACSAQVDGPEANADRPVAFEHAEGVKVASNLDSLQSSLPDNKVYRAFLLKNSPEGHQEVASVSFDLIDSCVTPGQRRGDASADVRAKFGNPYIYLTANLPADRKNSPICASWYNQTTARMNVVASKGEGAALTEKPDELNLALRGNLHVSFKDGTERVHQVVLGQGHQIVNNNWWTALEDAVIDKWHPGVACWDKDTKYQVCLDFDNPS
jgi:hypothetical protein